MIDSTNLKSTMNEPFESYAGEDPYIFVSYAHRDKESVYSTLKYLYDQKINIWYDEGIPPSAEWVEEIAQAIKRSSLFVLFMSPQALASRYVINEINYAVSLNKNILTVYLEETLLSDGLALCLQPFQSLEVDVEDWLPRALQAIKSQIIHTDSDNLVEFDSDSSSLETSFNLGQRLWGLWDQAIDCQNSRQESAHNLLKPPAKIEDTGEGVPGQITKARHLDNQHENKTKNGKTRHPWAVGVSVEEGQPEKQAEKSFQDEYAGSLIWIPAGEISIWVPYAEEQRKVLVKNGFWLGKYPVTQEIFAKVMGSNPSFTDSVKVESDLPVNNVSWLEAVSFCKALTILGRNNGTLSENLEFRLPTEVEWEYACRAGTESSYYFGDDPDDLEYHAWYKVNSEKSIHPVGQKNPNPWGLHDLYGNVREWVGKSFQNTLLNDNEQDEFRISRGGGYMKTASECKSSSRSTNSLHHRYRNLGFRLALAKLPNTEKVNS